MRAKLSLATCPRYRCEENGREKAMTANEAAYFIGLAADWPLKAKYQNVRSISMAACFCVVGGIGIMAAETAAALIVGDEAWRLSSPYRK